MYQFCGAVTAKVVDFFYEKPHFIMENFKFSEAAVGFKTFWAKYQKAHSYAKSGWINRLAYVAVAVFKRYMAPRKKYERTPIGKWKLDVVYNTAAATELSWSVLRRSKSVKYLGFTLVIELVSLAQKRTKFFRAFNYTLISCVGAFGALSQASFHV